MLPPGPRASDLPPLDIPPALARAGIAVWAAVLATVVVLSLSANVGPPGTMHVDKLMHALAYGGLAGMPFVIFGRARTVYAAALAMLPLGFGIEIAQGYVPNRVTDPGDALANVLGVALGAFLGPVGRMLANRWFGRGG